MYDVFISYRSKGGADLAGRIKDRLLAEGFHPFYASEEMKSGRYDHQLYDRIAECEHFVLVLPPKGLHKCISKSDWVRKEIEYALKNKKHIITVHMPGFQFPKQLPASIDVIRYIQAIPFTPNMFDFTMKTLLEYLRDPNWTPSEYDDTTTESQSHSLRPAIWIAIGVAMAIIFACFAIFGDGNNSDSGDIIDETTKTITDNTAPTVSITTPLTAEGSSYVSNGETILFSVHVSDNRALSQYNLFPSMIELDDGLSADITVTGTGNTRTVTLSNISGTPGKHKVTILEGCAVDDAGNRSFELTSDYFYIKESA
ncbi:MAG: TIR domain-containing protein [Clostridia bacterium]|nr:TIR domain-containing protein [Clostridia bacterium]